MNDVTRVSRIDSVFSKVQVNHDQALGLEIASNLREQNTSQNNVPSVDLAGSVDAVNQMMKDFSARLSFQLHKESNQMMVRVIDIHGNKVLKEIPPKEWLDLIGRIKDMVGLFIDERL